MRWTTPLSLFLYMKVKEEIALQYLSKNLHEKYNIKTRIKTKKIQKLIDKLIEYSNNGHIIILEDEFLRRNGCNPYLI